MKTKIISIFLFFILVNSCDEQSNSFIMHDAFISIDESRDILVLENYTIDCSLFTDQDSCTQNNWCSWSQNCISLEKDLLIVANQYDEGLVIYEIDNSDGIVFNEIYSNNSFEILDDFSLEDDLEIRQLVYSDHSDFIYILDKFEYVYSAWLPGLIDENSCNQAMSPSLLSSAFELSNLHSTQIVVDDSDLDSIDEVLILFKVNENNNSLQNLEGYATTTTSCSKFGTYKLSEQTINDYSSLGLDLNCSSELLPIAEEFNLFSSPIFDYNISDVHFKDNKVYIANPYDEFIIKNNEDAPQELDIDYYDSSMTINDGCDLPNNSIHFNDSGNILYNINSDIGYFEFNFHGDDLFSMYSDCPNGLNPSYKKCVTMSDDLYFSGDVNNQQFEIMISGNKMIGNLSRIGNSIATESRCGTLVGLNNLPEGSDLSLFDGNFYSLSVYDYVDDGIMNFYKDFKTNSKVKSIYEHNGYIVTGTASSGCYITLLEQSSHSIIDMPIFGSSNFAINNIFYDKDKNKLLLSCGNDGVLIYNWNGNSASADFVNHVISSNAYSAKLYKNSYVIIATKKGVEVYNYETY